MPSPASSKETTMQTLWIRDVCSSSLVLKSTLPKELWCKPLCAARLCENTSDKNVIAGVSCSKTSQSYEITAFIFIRKNFVCQTVNCHVPIHWDPLFLFIKLFITVYFQNFFYEYWKMEDISFSLHSEISSIFFNI